ncbi:hypothetical protein [Candidatus Hodarchaeum mangrovi]
MKDKQDSIQEFLDLNHKIWIVEFDSTDFISSLPQILEIPSKIFRQKAIEYLWTFLQKFLQNSTIAFILRSDDSTKDNLASQVDLALIGYWNNKYYGIPLWIMQDLLLGFEIIEEEKFIILDKESLFFIDSSNDYKTSFNDNETLIIVEENIFKKQKMFLEINNKNILITEYFNELDFFERIARTVIPEIDNDLDL